MAGEGGRAQVRVNVERVDKSVASRIVQQPQDSEWRGGGVGQGIHAAEYEPVASVLDSGILQGKAGELQVIERLGKGND